MSINDNNKDQDKAESKEGIDIKKVTIDENGEVKGLDDNELDDASGGLADTNIWCDSNC